MDKVALGNRIRALRGTKKPEEVANAVGISISALSMYETGHRVPRDNIKIALAKYFSVPVGDLFYPQDDTIRVQ